jgi:Amt family ammonium transporter
MTEEVGKMALQSLAQGFTVSDGLVLKRRNVTELKRFDGQTFPAEIVITQTENIQHFEYTLHIRDITQHIKLQNRLKLLAYNDPLTGLYNRTYFMENLEQRIQFHSESDGIVALMFLDLDQFKKINDTLGHKAGDELLIEVARRLNEVTRDNDLVGRWGGDEFVVVLSGELTESDAINKAIQILNIMRTPVQLTGNTLRVLTSVGLAISENGEINADKLLQHADLAMYQAKEAGRNTYRLFTEEMEMQANQHFQFESALPVAIKENQFYLEFQPKVSCTTNEVVGFEALIRWEHPLLGRVSPADFIPIIEKSSMIIDVGQWVINETCQKLALWREQGLPLVPVAINISGRHLHHKSLLPFIVETTQQYDIRTDLLEIEITEGVLTGDTEQSIAAMEALKAINIKLSIDDFGTGYSSLSYLKRFPIDVLKIDRLFVSECASNNDDAAICLAIITLAKSLGLQIVAEGVETEAQLAFLKQHECDVYQGFYFSQSIPAEQVPTLLHQGTAGI